MKGKVIVSVSNDLVSDQRVHKSCMSLHNDGWEVQLVGRKKRDSPALSGRPYATHRMRLLFEKGVLFYAEFNIRLLLFLLFSPYKVLHSNDLDTLLANYCSSKIKGGHLVYDSHEYFTEVPELVNRPSIQKVWKSLEKFLVPKIKYFFTVNDSIADLFEKAYGKRPSVLRNVPNANSKGKKSILTPSGKKILLLQGAGINIHRGAEELVAAMELITPVAELWIVGSGDVIPMLKNSVKTSNYENRVRFIDRVPLEELKAITANAYLGFSLDKSNNINYQYSLPNKLFDYIHSGVPVVISPLIEPQKIVEDYKVGVVLSEVSPAAIAEQVNALLLNEAKRNELAKNCLAAKAALNWEKEEKALICAYNSILDNS